jgi:poly-gamma-glutamate synthesis protein (capsule biosynthesis protein)
VHAGVGMNLDEASSPVYLETPNSRIALISITSSFVNPAAMAGKQSRRVPGRPGVNALRVNRYLEVTPENFLSLNNIAKESGINSGVEIARAEGYVDNTNDINNVELGWHLRCVVGNQNKYHVDLVESDMKRVEKAIYQAKEQADYILVSIHCHENQGNSKENPVDFLVDFSHRCIDMGAHAVLGHGPHLLRPLEIYKNRPIFYSLGDFMLHNESLNFAPEDFYEKYGLTSDDPICEAYKKRSHNYTIGLLTDRRMLESVVPYFEMVDGELTHLELLPIELGFDEPRYRKGTPSICTDRGIIERYAKMSEPYGTKIKINPNGIGVVDLK